jgi:hypothetical protein
MCLPRRARSAGQREERFGGADCGLAVLVLEAVLKRLAGAGIVE